KHILDMYGTKGPDGTFAFNCLLARRLAERGVRFIQLYHRGWDHHGGVKNGVKTTSGLVDQASAALIKDLKQRDMLKDTLVIWGGEFGRTPMAQGDGRDHHIKGFSREALNMVVAPVALRHRRAPEFATPDHQRVLEHVALLEVLDQRRRRLIHEPRRRLDAVLHTAVMVPATVVELDEAHA